MKLLLTLALALSTAAFADTTMIKKSSSSKTNVPPITADDRGSMSNDHSMEVKKESVESVHTQDMQDTSTDARTDKVKTKKTY